MFSHSLLLQMPALCLGCACCCQLRLDPHCTSRSINSGCRDARCLPTSRRRRIPAPRNTRFDRYHPYLGGSPQRLADASKDKRAPAHRSLARQPRILRHLADVLDVMLMDRRPAKRCRPGSVVGISPCLGGGQQALGRAGARLLSNDGTDPARATSGGGFTSIVKANPTCSLATWLAFSLA